MNTFTNMMRRLKTSVAQYARELAGEPPAQPAAAQPAARPQTQEEWDAADAQRLDEMIKLVKPIYTDPVEMPPLNPDGSMKQTPDATPKSARQSAPPA